MKKITILLVDDHAMFRSGMRMLLNAHMPDAEVIEAGSLNDAMQCLNEKLDVVLLDIKLPGLNGVEGIALVRRKWPEVPVMMLSSQDEPDTVRAALARGATCFISKADTAERIVAMLEKITCGEIVAPLAQADLEVPGILMHLTPRQCEVLELLSRGMSNKVIAKELDLSENTVRGHVQAILGFLQVSSRTEAAFAARQRGLVG